MEPTLLLLCLEGRSKEELRSHFTEQIKSCHLAILPGTVFQDPLQEELLADQEHLVYS